LKGCIEMVLIFVGILPPVKLYETQLPASIYTKHINTNLRES